ncbi:MAG: glycosyltransferase family 4 protein [Bacillota bacterium]
MSQDSPKVLFVATVARHLLAFHTPYFKLLQEWGFNVEAACNPGGEAEAFTPLGVKLHDVPFGRRPFSRGNTKALVRMIHLIKNQPYALIHVHTPVASFVARLAARICSFRPVLYTAHGFHFYKGAPARNWLLYYPMEWLAARWTDGLIVLNQEDLSGARRLPVRGETFLIPGVGVLLDSFSVSQAKKTAILEDLGLRADMPVAVMAAEFSRVKNHAQAIRAWKEVVAVMPGAVLLLAGDGERRQEIENLAKSMGLQENIRFLGFRTDIARIIAVADVVVLTSKREGLPRVILEAMAAGKPVVATDVRGCRDLVVHGKTGFLVGVGDVAGTAKALLKLLANKKLAVQLGTKGRQEVEACRLEEVRLKMAGVYRRYLIGPRSEVINREYGDTDLRINGTAFQEGKQHRLSKLPTDR